MFHDTHPELFSIRSDGRRQLPDPNLPATRDFAHRATWRPLDAAVMREHMANRFTTQYGRGLFLHWAANLLRNGIFTGRGEVDAFAQDLATRTAAAWSSPEFMTVLAHDDFAAMAMAAAIQAPSTAISTDELISRSGVVVFATKQDLGQVDPSLHYTIDTRAVSWIVDDEMDAIMVAIYADGPDAEQRDIAMYDLDADQAVIFPRAYYQYLVPSRQSISPLRDGRAAAKVSAELDSHNDAVLRLVRAIAAIARSPRTSTLTTNPARDQVSRKKRSRRHAAPDTDITVLNLCNPEHGRYELDAATGRHLRQHYVRGHWRNQWYPGSQDHRIIWVDGFIRGDAELGTVTSPKVYVAR